MDLPLYPGSANLSHVMQMCVRRRYSLDLFLAATSSVTRYFCAADDSTVRYGLCRRGSACSI